MAENMRDILDALAAATDLTAEQAAFAFRELFEGELSPAQAGALLMGLRAKGETPLELASAARAGLARAKVVSGLPAGTLLDIVGTGGDRTHSFNCSTAVSLYLAALGHTVVKHGNRAVSSSCGSADALEGLGLPLSTGPDEVAAELGRTGGFVFLFAPNYHPAFAHIAPVRREMGIRTLFNLMGPLLNPARPTHQLLGVGLAGALPLMAETLALTSPTVHAFVIHGAGGYDELTPFGPTIGYQVEAGMVRPLRIEPKEFGLAGFAPEDVRVGDKDSAVAALRAILSGTGSPAMQAMTALNLGAALHLATGKAMSQCMSEAAQAVADGAAKRFALNG